MYITPMSSSPTINDSEEKLVAAIKKGSIEAFGMLYDKYAPALFGILTRIIEDDELAETALQKCFIQIWHSKNLYNPSCERLFTWMLKIARTIGIKAREEKYGSVPNQKGKLYVNDINHDKLNNNNVILELITIGVSEKEAAEKMGVSNNELRQMLRKEINQLRGVPVE